MSTGPFAVRFGAFPAVAPQAGTVEQVPLEVENAGSLPWRRELFVSYHWLDTRDNPIHWDGIRTPAPPLAPGERATVTTVVRAPIPPGRYRLAFDLVAELRAWFSKLGSPMLVQDVDVAAREAEPNAAPLPEGSGPRAGLGGACPGGACRGIRGRRRSCRMAFGGTPSPAEGAGRIRAGPGPGPRLLEPAPRAVGATGRRARAARRARRPPGLRRPTGRAVGLRRPHRAAPQAVALPGRV